MIERVHFTKPAIREYAADGYTPVDMHVHSRYSDTFTRIGNILRKASKRGFGVAITDHNEIKGSLEAIKKAKGRGILVVPGMELSLKEGCHFLTYFHSKKDMEEFYNKHIKKNKNKNPFIVTNVSVNDLFDLAKDYNGFCSAAHPVSLSIWNVKQAMETKRINRDVGKKLDAIEVISGLLKREYNLNALRWASSLNKPITGGSDSHTLKNLGSVVTCAKADDIDNFLESIRKHRNFVAGKEARIAPKFFCGIKSVSRHTKYVRHIGPSMKIHYELTRENIRRVRKKRAEREG